MTSNLAALTVSGSALARNNADQDGHGGDTEAEQDLAKAVPKARHRQAIDGVKQPAQGVVARVAGEGRPVFLRHHRHAGAHAAPMQAADDAVVDHVEHGDWPLSAFLVEHLGWRGACITYAAMQITIALPIHLLLLPRTSTAITDKRRGPVRLESHEFRVFLILATIITISSAILSLMGTHLLPLLQARGLNLFFAVGLGMIVGPSQVGARLVEMFTGSRYHPFWTMAASVILIAVAAVMLLVGFPLVIVAIVLYGAGNGLSSIARGTVPLALFGPERYPVLMGRLALPLMIAMAISPFLGGLAFEHGGAAWTLALLTALALTNVLLIGLLWMLLRTERRAYDRI